MSTALGDSGPPITSEVPPTSPGWAKKNSLAAYESGWTLTKDGRSSLQRNPCEILETTAPYRSSPPAARVRKHNVAVQPIPECVSPRGIQPVRGSPLAEGLAASPKDMSFSRSLDITEEDLTGPLQTPHMDVQEFEENAREK